MSEEKPLEIDERTRACLLELGSLCHDIFIQGENTRRLGDKVNSIARGMLADTGITRDDFPKKGNDDQELADTVYGWWW